MNKKEFQIVAAVITSAFHIPFTIEKIELWYRSLCDLEYERTDFALKKLIRTHTGPLNIAHIIEAYNSLDSNALSSIEAIALINTAIAKFGRYKAVEALEFIKEQDQAAYEVVKAMGFTNVCNANANFIRPEFLKLYDKAAQDIKTNAMLSGEVRSAISQLSNQINAQEIARLQDNEY